MPNVRSGVALTKETGVTGSQESTKPILASALTRSLQIIFTLCSYLPSSAMSRQTRLRATQRSGLLQNSREHRIFLNGPVDAVQTYRASKRMFSERYFILIFNSPRRGPRRGEMTEMWSLSLPLASPVDSSRQC